MPNWEKNSKLDKSIAKRMRWIYKRFNITKEVIGKLFGVSRVHAGRVINGVCWSGN